MNKQHVIRVLRQYLVAQDEVRALLEELEKDDTPANDVDEDRWIEETVTRRLRRKGLIK